MTVSFSGITRPVPASVFDLASVSCFLWTRSICRYRSPQFLVAQSTVQIYHEGRVHVLAPQLRSVRERAFSSAV